MRAFAVAMLAVGLSVLASGTASADPDMPIAVGQVVPSQPESPVQGWRRFSSAMFAARTTANGVTTETHTCCVLVLTRGDEYVVARTEAVEKGLAAACSASGCWTSSA